MATIGWFVTNRQNRILARRKHTYEFLQQFLHNDKHVQRIKRFVKVIKMNQLPDPDDAVREDDVESIRYVLNHYEYLSVGMINGDMDENVIFDTERTFFIKVFDHSLPYINKLRQLRKQPSAYKGLEYIVNRWRTEKRTWTQRIWEYLVIEMKKPERS